MLTLLLMLLTGGVTNTVSEPVPAATFATDSQQASSPVLVQEPIASTPIITANIEATSPEFSQFPSQVQLKLTGTKVPLTKSSEALPGNIMAVAFFNFSTPAWENVELFNPFPVGLEELDLQEQILVLPEGMSFGENIAPWLDSQVAIAFQSPSDLVLETVDLDDPVGFITVFESSISIIMPSSDDSLLDDFLTELLDNHSRAPERISYGGYEILAWQIEEPTSTFPKIDIFGELGNATAIANIDGNLVLASNPVPIKAMIDARAEAGNLLSSKEFLRVLMHPQWSNSITTTYGDYGEFVRIAEVLFPDSDEFEAEFPFDYEDIKTGLESAAKEYSKFDGYFWIAKDGMYAQSRSYYANPSPSRAYLNDANGILAKLPGRSLVSISSRNFKQQWQWLDEQTELYPTYGFMLDFLREATPEILGLDLEEDLIAWMDGEYAAVLFPSNQGLGQALDLDLGIGFLLETSDRLAATRTLNKLTDFALTASDGNIQIAQRQIGGKTFTSWEVPEPENAQLLTSAFAYGWLDDNTIAVATGKSQLFAFSPEPDPAIVDTQLFQDAIANMPQPNLGYFFMNLDGLVDFTLTTISPEFLTLAPPEAIQLLNALQSMTLVYSSTAEHIQADFYLGLEPIEK
ncbi:hypothetical protein Pse7367_2570 [Thalassoporum mexicanum PCC 7367]|uniref:DUF3352 domain-containing protein n=1 Tax=Thalassoporum mexicanum TaxID=3457544 RepID=UPI00029F87B4|nr:DUF3352 domain-containing protein [Pseudanabaena sp. PCC 7367]AFY70828.1 hypothetical protein Pse7367_2570 [Pseudanabaena sp. PCC 7367]